MSMSLAFLSLLLCILCALVVCYHHVCYQVRLTKKGYAFVDFVTHEVAAKAIESMHDKNIKVRTHKMFKYVPHRARGGGRGWHCL